METKIKKNEQTRPLAKHLKTKEQVQEKEQSNLLVKQRNETI